jgi:eukaryotic-like serine/threonine-protein kinase
VVVYAFSSETAAQHKVETINALHPDLKAEVFTAAGHGPWLVTVGGAMDRDQAFQLRSQVRKEGLPGDSYAQNYSH